MILLDTDHFTVLTDKRDKRHEALKARVLDATEQVGSSIVSIEEVLRGWLAFISRHHDVRRQLVAYDRLAQFFDLLSDWYIVPFNAEAADKFAALRQQRIRIGTMDLKIAATALVNDALLVTTKQRDFAHVPGLRCEDWLKE